MLDAYLIFLLSSPTRWRGQRLWIMMMPWHRNHFRITYLMWESTIHQLFPLRKCYANLLCFPVVDRTSCWTKSCVNSLEEGSSNMRFRPYRMRLNTVKLVCLYICMSIYAMLCIPICQTLAGCNGHRILRCMGVSPYRPMSRVVINRWKVLQSLASITLFRG